MVYSPVTQLNVRRSMPRHVKSIRVDETELGLRELGLTDVAAMFREAYEFVSPYLSEIREPDGDYYTVIEQAGHARRIEELTDQARSRLGTPRSNEQR